MTLLCSKAGKFFLLFMMVMFSMRVMSQDIITKQPTDISRCAGFRTFFEVMPDNAPDYQWQVDKNDGAGFTDITGAKGYFYDSEAQLSMNGYLYRVIVKNAAGASQTSTAAKLTVNATPSIATFPISTTVCEHATASFSVLATGSGTFSYNWFRKPPSGSFTILSNTNSPTLRLTDVSPNMAGYQYWVEVSDGNCLATTKSNDVSKQAFLRVTQASLIITNPGATCSTSPTPTVNLKSSDVTAGSTAGLTFSYFRDIAATNTLNQPEAVSESGTYYIRGTKDGCNTELKPVLVTINAAPSVTIAPQEQELVCSGGETGIILTDTNVGNTTLFKWTVSTNANLTGASNQTSPVAGPIIQKLTNTSSDFQTITYTITPVASPCPDGSPVGVDVEVSTVAAPIPDFTLTPPSVVSVCSGVALSVAISPSGTQYKWTFLSSNNNVTGGNQSSQSAISPGPLKATLSSTASTDQLVTYLVTAYGGVNANYCASKRKKLDVTVKPKSVVKATPAEVSICSGGSTDVVLEDTSGMSGTQYTWVVSTTSTALGDIQSQNRTTAGNSPMTVKLTSNSSTTTEQATYTVTPVATNGCSGTPLPVPVSVSPPPVGITEQPSSKTLCVGDKLELTVKAGTSTVTYQWKKDGNTIPGATNASYVIEALAAADAGKYKAEVTASGCISPSTEAEVTVKTAESFFETTPTVSSHDIDYTGYVDFEYTGPEAVLEWKFGDQTGSPMAKVRHYYYKSDTFSVELTAKRNLSCSKSFAVGEIRVGGPNVELVTANETRGGLTFFPNPVRDRLYLKSEAPLQRAILFDAMGKILTTVVLEGKEDVVEVETLPPGLYVIQVKTQKERVNLKLMKQ